MAVVQSSAPLSTPSAQSTKREFATERASETVVRLQRGILRLALAYHGHSTDLDRKLKQLSALLRNRQRDSGLQQLIDEIIDAIVAVGCEQVPRSPPANVGEGCELLLHFLQHIAAPPTILDDIAELRQELITRSATSDVLSDIERTAGALSLQLSAASDNARIADQFRLGLLDLIDRLALSRPLVAERSQLRGALAAATTVASVRPCLSALTELLGKIQAELHVERARLTDFLRATAERLIEFEETMVRSTATHSASATDALQLSTSVGTELQDLRTEVSTAGDLDALKSLVDRKLTTIDSSLTRFVSAQTARANAATEVVERMTNRLKDLEQQAAHLRTNLEVQHARVLVDPLTGMLNRAGYTEAVSKLYARWQRYGGALSLAVIDLDWFKEINDRYGHAAGDRVLATVAAKIKEVVRQSDLLCRYGGEEFVLLLPETTVTDAKALLEKLRAQIEQCPFRHNDTPVRVTMSGGVAMFQVGDDINQVFERADQAMYHAKNRGRNCVSTELDTPSVTPPPLD